MCIRDRDIVLQAGKDTYRIVLQASAHTLGDVVVTGYQELERRKLTAAIAKVDVTDGMVGAAKKMCIRDRCQNIIKVHHTSLITINQYPFAFIILASNTHTVSIRVGSHYEVSVNFFGKVYSHRKSFRVFRVRRYEMCIRDSVYPG